MKKMLFIFVVAFFVSFAGAKLPSGAVDFTRYYQDLVLMADEGDVVHRLGFLAEAKNDVEMLLAAREYTDDELKARPEFCDLRYSKAPFNPWQLEAKARALREIIDNCSQEWNLSL
ncbi:hypothetical protein FJ366_03195 [Candidatus Dependentiae bacterium]|nr:hypothetical protein [Candidatus Dependentiae bacterium]